MATTSNDNKVCVKVETVDLGKLHFMEVTRPEFAEIRIGNNGTVWININDSCVCRINKAANLTVIDERTIKQ